jgi:ATP-dependent helicase HrpB
VTTLPIDEVLPRLADTFAATHAVVLCAPPGSGKTTRVPLALMEAPWLQGRRVVMLEPRRVAARAAARFMAASLDESVGERVGFRVRFESAVSQRTRVEVVTEGVLTRRLQRDPELGDTALVIFDEFHERSLEADLALALTLDVRRQLRPDLRVLVMSATLDATPVARLLGGAPVLTAGGRPYPVTLHHSEPAPRGRRDDPRHPDSVATAVASAVRRTLAQGDGDVLAFLPGAAAIRRTVAALGDLEATGVVVAPLHGELAPDVQDRALCPDPGGRRRVVLATNIAETSLTIDGVSAVVDSGLARRPRFDPNSGLTRLQTVPVSRASAEQRAGRAGRQGPGRAVRLWSEAEHARRPGHDPPEILEADLAPLALELAHWGVSEPCALQWLDSPPPASWARGRDLLAELGALDAHGRLTPLGRRMVAIPAHPRLAAMLAASASDAERALAADLAALLESPDPLRGQDAGTDLAPRLDALARYREAGRRADAGASARALARAERVASRLRSRHASVRPAPADQAGALLLRGYPDRVARRRDGARGRFLLATGRGLRLPPEDPLAGEDWLVVPDLDAGTTDARAYRAAAVSLEAIRTRLAPRIRSREHIAWDEREGAVAAVREERLGAILIAATPLSEADGDALVSAMLDGVRQLGLDALPWSGPIRSLQARIESLRAWEPDAGWPASDDDALREALDEWLAPVLAGIRRREHLHRLDLDAALRARLPARLAARLDDGAPTHLRVPGGSRVPLTYLPGEAPRLPVKLQEMFGCRETPTVCWGRVPVVLELLSPARRPLHVTRDLDSFWRNGYPQVRKEMRGRYPKHPWPEDPLAATPTRHTHRRR